MNTVNDNNKQDNNNYYEPENVNYDFDTYPPYYCPMCNDYRLYNQSGNELIDDYGNQDEYFDSDNDSFYRQGTFGRPRRRRRRRRRRRFPFLFPFTVFPFFFPFDEFDDDWDEY